MVIEISRGGHGVEEPPSEDLGVFVVADRFFVHEPDHDLGEDGDDLALDSAPGDPFDVSHGTRERSENVGPVGVGVGFMAAFGFTVIAVGVLASLQADGWRVPAWVTALLPAGLGSTSILFPGAASSVDLGEALAALTWGLVFLVSAELTETRGRAGSPGHRTPGAAVGL